MNLSRAITRNETTILYYAQPLPKTIRHQSMCRSENANKVSNTVLLVLSYTLSNPCNVADFLYYRLAL